jgi:hypothetical protein
MASRRWQRAKTEQDRGCLPPLKVSDERELECPKSCNRTITTSSVEAYKFIPLPGNIQEGEIFLYSKVNSLFVSPVTADTSVVNVSPDIS